MIPKNSKEPKRSILSLLPGSVLFVLALGAVAIPLVAILTNYSGDVGIEASKEGGKVWIKNAKPSTLPVTNDR